jgi:hypothetical protein
MLERKSEEHFVHPFENLLRQQVGRFFVQLEGLSREKQVNKPQVSNVTVFPEGKRMHR